MSRVIVVCEGNSRQVNTARGSNVDIETNTG